MTPARRGVKYVAFLRAINVGGHVVKMDHLRKLFEKMGFTSVETFIASGNVIFDSSSSDASALETRIARDLKKALGYEVETFIRSCAEVAAIAVHEPFGDVPKDCKLHVCFLKTTADKATREKLIALRTKDDDFAAHKRELYWKTRGSFGQSPAAVPFGKIAGTIGTMRNVTTVRKLAAKYPV